MLFALTLALVSGGVAPCVRLSCVCVCVAPCVPLQQLHRPRGRRERRRHRPRHPLVRLGRHAAEGEGPLLPAVAVGLRAPARPLGRARDSPQAGARGAPLRTGSLYQAGVGRCWDPMEVGLIFG